MKIAILAPSEIPSRRANSIQTMKMAQAFVQLGHQVLLLSPGSDQGVDWDELEEHYGIRADLRFDIEWLGGLNLLRRYDVSLRAVLRTRSWNADLFLTRMPQAAAFASGLGMPTILEVHDLPPGRMGPIWFRAFLQGSGMQRLVLISQALEKTLDARYDLPDLTDFIQVLPDGVDLFRYQSLPGLVEARKQLKMKEKFTVGYTGHLYAGRGIEIILAIAKELPEVYFLLVGGNPKDVESVQDQIISMGLTNIRLEGFVSNTKLPLYQAACEVLLMPYEAKVAASSGGDIARFLSPMKMFEYLASGRVILSSDLPVLQEVLRQEHNSILLPSQDAEAWAEVIRGLIADPSKRESLGAEAIKTAAEYSWQARAEKMLVGLE